MRWRELRRLDPRRSWAGYLLATGVGLALALTALDPGPSRGLAPPLRLVFWLAHCLVPIALLELAQIVLGRLAFLDGRPPLLRVVMAGLAGAALFAPVALLLDQAFPLPTGLEDDAGLLVELAGEFAAFAPPLLLVWIGLNAPRLLSLGQPAEPVPPPASEPHPLWSRTPRRIGRDVVAVSAELHYLRIVTTGGEALILFSFGRALPLLEDVPGLRIHRSHWIALAHVQAVRRDGERVTVHMVTGQELPVSRAHRAALRTALEHG